MTKILASSLALILAASGAQAVELLGANAGLSYGKMTEAPFNNFEKTQLEASAEVGFAPSLSVQGDIALTALTRANRDADSYGLHAIYNTNADLAVGAFAAYDDVQGYDISSYGVEVAGRASGVAYEAYIGRTDDDKKIGELFGLSAQIDLIEEAKMGLRYDNIDLGAARTERLSLTGEYKATSDITLTAELGKMRVNEANSEPFFTIGAKWNFGGKAAPTFKQRNVMAIVPGL